MNENVIPPEELQKIKDLSVKLANGIGPILESMLPDHANPVLLVSWFSDPAKVSVISPLDTTGRACVVAGALMGMAQTMHQDTYNMLKHIEELETELRTLRPYAPTVGENNDPTVN